MANSEHQENQENTNRTEMICTQRQAESGRTGPLQKGSCKQVTTLKQYSWIPLEKATIIITHCLPHREGFQAQIASGSSLTQSKLDSLTLSLRWCVSTRRFGSTHPATVQKHHNKKSLSSFVSARERKSSA